MIRNLDVRQNPNWRAPLAAIVCFSADRNASITVCVNDGAKRWSVDYPAIESGDHVLPLVGMRAGRMHLVCLSAHGEDGSVFQSEPFEYRTPSPPPSETEFPSIRVTQKIEGRMEPGVTIFCVRRRNLVRAHWQNRRQFDWARLFGLLVAIDSDGEVIWTYRAEARIAGIEMLHNGHILFHTTEFCTYEIDLLGNTVRMFYAERRPQGKISNAIGIDAASIHHQPHQMPNGNFLAMTANAREVPNYYTSERDPAAPRETKNIVGDRIIEFTPDGKEVWSWNAFDHLDVYRIGYHVLDPYWHTRGFPHHADWTHGNGVTYDSATERVIVSLKHQDAIIGIDRQSGQIAWILGHHGGWPERLRPKLLTPVGDLQWPWHMHNPRVTNRGTIILYDNGTMAAMPFDKPKAPHETFSRAVEYAIDETSMTIRQVWASAHEMNEDSVSVWAMGDAHVLPRSGNVFVVDSIVMAKRNDMQWNEWSRDWHPNDFPYTVRIREYSHTEPPEVLWEVWMDNPHDIICWEVFGGLRATSLYQDSGAVVTTEPLRLGR